jgi:hypothetical protein
MPAGPSCPGVPDTPVLVFGTRAVIPNTIAEARENWGYFTYRYSKGMPQLAWAPESPPASNVEQHRAHLLYAIEEKA